MKGEEREGAMLLILGGKLGLELVHVFSSQGGEGRRKHQSSHCRRQPRLCTWLVHVTIMLPRYASLSVQSVRCDCGTRADDSRPLLCSLGCGGSAPFGLDITFHRNEGKFGQWGDELAQTNSSHPCSRALNETQCCV